MRQLRPHSLCSAMMVLFIVIACGCVSQNYGKSTVSRCLDPLAPLTVEEIATVRQLLKSQALLIAGVSIASMTLQEPQKGDLITFSCQKAPSREAAVVLFNQSLGRTTAVSVNLSEQQVTSVQTLSTQPPLLDDEFRRSYEIAIKDKGVQSAFSKRNILDLSKIHFEPWAPGFVTLGEAPGRIARLIPYYKEGAATTYARPIDGLIISVDLSRNAVASVIDNGFTQIPRDSFHIDPSPSQDPKASQCNESTPASDAIQIDDNQISWRMWRFRWAFHPREGLVLYTIGAQDAAQPRSILYRAALSEIVVPYADPDRLWSWKNALDEGEYGLGRSSVKLRRGEEVPCNAHLLSAVFADQHGEPTELGDRVALYERDAGILWTHTDETGETRTRRSRQLVMEFIFVVGNYDYLVRWIFFEDGRLKFEVSPSGILLTKVVSAAKCVACSSEKEKQQTFRYEQQWGTPITKDLLAINHQHIFNVRLDFDIDGVKNSVRELTIHRPAKNVHNPLGNAFALNERILRTEKEGVRDFDFENLRLWKVSGNSTSTLGHYPGYMLEPEGIPFYPMAAAHAKVREEAKFINHPLKVTRYYATELYASDNYPRWATDNQSIENDDLVVWYTFGITHIPRTEEWPIMPAPSAGFTLMPHQFFAFNPTFTQ